MFRSSRPARLSRILSTRSKPELFNRNDQTGRWEHLPVCTLCAYAEPDERPVVGGIRSAVVPESCDHFVGKTGGADEIADLGAGAPPGFRQFAGITFDGLVSVNGAVKAHEQGAVEAPGLRAVIGDVFDVQTDLLHDLTGDGLLHGLADLAVACDQGAPLVGAVGVTGEDDPLPVGASDADDEVL